MRTSLQEALDAAIEYDRDGNLENEMPCNGPVQAENEQQQNRACVEGSFSVSPLSLRNEKSARVCSTTEHWSPSCVGDGGCSARGCDDQLMRVKLAEACIERERLSLLLVAKENAQRRLQWKMDMISGACVYVR